MRQIINQICAKSSAFHAEKVLVSDGLLHLILKSWFHGEVRAKLWRLRTEPHAASTPIISFTFQPSCHLCLWMANGGWWTGQRWIEKAHRFWCERWTDASFKSSFINCIFSEWWPLISITELIPFCMSHQGCQTTMNSSRSHHMLC